MSRAATVESEMFAVIRSGGKQYRVSVGDVLTLEKIEVEAGSSFDFTDVLLVGGDGETKIGEPTVPGAVVRADVLSHLRGAKVICFKRRRRKSSSKSTRGHRQQLTQAKILEISAGGATAPAAKEMVAAEPETVAAEPADREE